MGASTSLEPSGPVQSYKGIALPLLEDCNTYMLCTACRYWLLNAPDSLEFNVSIFDGCNVGWLNTLPSVRSIKQSKTILKAAKFIKYISR